MNLSPTLWLEIGVAGLCVLGIIWARPEYGLFLYALALGFPDLAFPLGDAINIRADDVLLLMLLPRTILWTPAPVSPGQRKVFTWQGLFLAACLLSVAVQLGRGDSPGTYETAKLIGCAAILLTLPRLVQSERRLLFFISGLICGGIALVIQMLIRLGSSSSNAYTNIQELKSAATFTTWNGNTIGQAAVLFVFAAGLGAVIFPEGHGKRFLWLCSAMGFALVPAWMFVRGTSLSLAAGFILFFCLARRWKLALLFVMVCLAVFLYLRSSERRLEEDATQVNLTTGEGLSHRFERWDVAFQGIRAKPTFGHGFGQEWNYLSPLGSEGRAHNAYLTAWLELGLGGLLLFLAATFQFVRTGLSLYKDPRFRLRGALILSLTAALGIDSLGLPTLYWEKLPTIALALAIVVIGVSERKASEIAQSDALRFVFEPISPQL